MDQIKVPKVRATSDTIFIMLCNLSVTNVYMLMIVEILYIHI